MTSALLQDAAAVLALWTLAAVLVVGICGMNRRGRT